MIGVDEFLETSEDTKRLTCYVCGKRRQYRLFVLLGVPGLAFPVCRDHPDWKPVEGEDFTVEDES